MPRLILIVEDTAALASSLALGLAGIDGTEAVVFGSAAEATRFLEFRPRDIAALVSDLNLPDDNGFSLIRRIRAAAPHRKLPALLITAEENPAPPPGDLLASPDAIIQKPFSIREVRRVLETLL